MSYSLDLRARVVDFDKSGGKKAEAHRRFNVSLWCIQDWCKRSDLEPQKPRGRHRKMDWEKLSRDIEQFPDKLLRERAHEFGVRINAIWHACRVMKISHKKSLPYVERDHESRIIYLKTLRKVIEKQGSKNIVYVDESGFDFHTFRPFAWSIRGKKSYGERHGTRGIRTNLIAAKRGKEMLAPVLYQTSTTAQWFNQWMKNHLLEELHPSSTIIMANARSHKKVDIEKIASQAGHHVLFLPPYSPDMNTIE